MRLVVHALRVNVKSLAAEARFIRTEVRRSRDREVGEYLHYHRTSRLKPEARMAHLALAYCKGKPYKSAENSAKTLPDVRALAKKLNRFLPYPDRVSEEQVEKWLAT
jgi:hypothetical protein